MLIMWVIVDCLVEINELPLIESLLCNDSYRNEILIEMASLWYQLPGPKPTDYLAKVGGINLITVDQQKISLKRFPDSNWKPVIAVSNMNRYIVALLKI